MAAVSVEVEYDYNAEHGDELSIRAGEVINNVKQMTGGWWEGTLKGKRGLFPENFVKVLPAGNGDKEKSQDDQEQVELRSKKDDGQAADKKCRVLFSYQPVHEDELELALDQVIDFLGEVEDGWWRGRMAETGKIGVFPSNFVEMVKVAAGAGGNNNNLNNNNNVNLAASATSSNHSATVLVAASAAAAAESPSISDKNRKNVGLGKIAARPPSASQLIVDGNHLGDKASNGRSSLQSSPRKPAAKLPVKAEPPSESSSDHQAQLKSHVIINNNKNVNNNNNNNNIAMMTKSTTAAAAVEDDDGGGGGGGPRSAAPKLPPKPVKEQCVVTFPYSAQNEDELTLVENQVITIISKEVEDKGWWKGELDGKIGVFPDNFVKLLPPSPAQPHVKIDLVKSKRPTTASKLLSSSNDSLSKAPHHHHLQSGSSNDDDFGKARSKTFVEKSAFSAAKVEGTRKNSAECAKLLLTAKPASSTISKPSEPPASSLLGGSPDKKAPSEDSSRMMINRFSLKRSSEKFTSVPFFSKDSSKSSSLTKIDSKAKKSFGKGTPAPLKPTTAQAGSAAPLASQPGSSARSLSSDNILACRKKSGPVVDPPSWVDDDTSTGFDCVEKGDRLVHLTASRVKAPKRRPPSSHFGRDQDANLKYGGNDHSCDEDRPTRSQQPPPDDGPSSSSPFKRRAESGDTDRSKSNESLNLDGGNVPADEDHNRQLHPPRPRMDSSSQEANNRKPEWLQELSRKQAHRKSEKHLDSRNRATTSTDLKTEQQQQQHSSIGSSTSSSSGISSSNASNNSSCQTSMMRTSSGSGSVRPGSLLTAQQPPSSPSEGSLGPSLSTSSNNLKSRHSLMTPSAFGSSSNNNNSIQTSLPSSTAGGDVHQNEAAHSHRMTKPALPGSKPTVVAAVSAAVTGNQAPADRPPVSVDKPQIVAEKPFVLTKPRDDAAAAALRSKYPPQESKSSQGQSAINGAKSGGPGSSSSSRSSNNAADNNNLSSSSSPPSPVSSSSLPPDEGVVKHGGPDSHSVDNQGHHHHAVTRPGGQSQGHTKSGSGTFTGGGLWKPEEAAPSAKDGTIARTAAEETGGAPRPDKSYRSFDESSLQSMEEELVRIKSHFDVRLDVLESELKAERRARQQLEDEMAQLKLELAAAHSS